MSSIVNWTLLLKQFRPCLDLGGLPPATRRVCWSSTPVHSTWYSWWTERNWYRFFSKNFSFPVTVFFLPMLRIQIAFIHYWCVVSLATDSCLFRPYALPFLLYLNSCIMNWILGKETCGRTLGIRKRNSFYTAVNLNLMLCNSYGQVETYWFILTIYLPHIFK
jgi:hypothetical protein